MNNQDQITTLNAFTSFLDEEIKHSIELYEKYGEDRPPKEVQEKQKDAYINAMADMIFHNPSVLLKTVSQDESKEPYHYVIEMKDGEDLHIAVIYTDESRIEKNASYIQMPFVDVLNMIVNVPEFKAVTINPTEKHKHFIFQETIEEFLPFSNIEFIGL